MWLDTLQIAREAAIILLALEIFVLSLAPLLILYYVTKWLRTFIPKGVPALREGRRWVFQAFAVIVSIMATIRAPFVWLLSANEALKTWIVRFQRLIHQDN